MFLRAISWSNSPLVQATVPLIWPTHDMVESLFISTRYPSASTWIDYCLALVDVISHMGDNALGVSATLDCEDGYIMRSLAGTLPYNALSVELKAGD